MFVNKPAGVSETSLLPMHHPVAAALTPSSSSAAAASAAASASAASEAAIRTHPQRITHVALHLLGPASSDGVAAIPVELSLSAAPPHTTELGLDLIGIVAQYLPLADQLVLRGVSEPLRTVVDPLVKSLTITGQQACALLAERGSFPKLDALYLNACDDAVLIQLADVLQTAPRAKLSITLDGYAGAWVSANGLRAIAGATLAGLHVKGLPIAYDAAQALARSASPVSISLQFRPDGITDVYWLTQIGTLTALSTGNHPVSAVSIAALAVHPNLTALSLDKLAGSDIRWILTSQSLRLFSVGSITSAESEAFEAFADNRSLKSLAVGGVAHPASLVSLSRNSTLTSVNLYLHRSVTSAIPHLANLPALDALAIGSSKMLMPDDVRALCAKPLSSLSIRCGNVDPAALELIVQAPVATLFVAAINQPITDAIVDALIANERISALSLTDRVIVERLALRLIASPTLEKLKVEFDSHFRAVAEENFRRTWLAAGKSLKNLEVTAYQTEQDEPAAAPLG